MYSSFFLLGILGAVKGSKLSVRELERAHSAHLLWNGTSGCQELARVGSKKVCRRFLPLQSRNVPEVRVEDSWRGPWLLMESRKGETNWARPGDKSEGKKHKLG